jgi:tRNA A-37 threonylcarbamoyl transferase component Bud32
VERRDLSGQVLDGRYAVIEPVGKGAMGSVYRADDRKLGRVVAIKVMNEHVPNEMGARRRFDREAQAMAKLEHPHCASILDVGMHDGQPFVVMDFIAGQSLDALVAEGPLPIPRAIELTRQILFGLAHAHEHGIVHRDIKPANIVLSHKAGMGDHVKILDFGLAKIGQETSNLTAGVIVGTPSYMAPEQIRGLLLDGRADVYACGVLLFELLTGEKPFRAANNDPLAICMMHLNEPAPRLADKLPGRDFGALEQVVAQALAKERDHRFGSAMAFANALSNHKLPRASTPEITVGAAGTSGTANTVALPEVNRPSQATIALSDGDLVAPVPLASAPAPLPNAPARSRTKWFVLGGAVCATLIVVVVGIAARGTSRVPDGKPVAIADAAVGSAAPPKDSEEPAVPGEDPAHRVLTRADELVAQRWRDGAIDVLVKGQRAHPKDARLPYRAGLLFMEKMWWPDGLKQLRAAIALDPDLRSDPELIRAAVRAFSATASYDWSLAGFLRNDIGDAARPYLEEAATQHKNPVVRNRAKAELAKLR